jgi:hypothetical protein
MHMNFKSTSASGRLLRASAVGLLVVHGVACNETRRSIRDDLPAGAAKGYVSFYTKGQGEGMGLKIVGIEGGNELPPVRNGDSWSGVGDLRLARTPGWHEFIASHQKYSERFRVPVEEGQVTFVSFRRQITGVLVVDKMTTTSYMVRGSQGRHPLPADPATTDPRRYLEALDDGDWGTRHHALERLASLAPPLDAVAVAKVRRMALEDPVEAVREGARGLLSAGKLPLPAPPIALDTFEVNADGRWYVGGGNGDPVAFTFEPDGYQIESRDGNEHWVVAGAGPLTHSRSSSELIASGDVDFTVDCTWKGGAANRGYGLVLGRDKGTFHAFLVARSGGTMSAPAADSKWRPASLPWVQTAAKAIASSPTTRILVSRRKDRYALSVNGVPVGTVVDPEAMPVQSIGFLVSGAQTVVFNRLVISRP